MNRFRVFRAVAAVVLATCMSCGGGSGGPNASGGTTGSGGGGTSGGGTPGSTGGSTATGGSGGVVGSGGSGGSPATGGQTAAPGGTTGTTGGTTGTAGAGGSGGVVGTGGGGSGGAAAGAGGSVATGGVPGGGGATGAAGSHGNKVLLYTKATGFVHSSTPIAAAQISKSIMALGLVPETSADPAKFTTAALADYAVVVLIATTGEPFGTPGTTQVQALVDWVHGGGGLVAIENADHAYDNNAAYVNLIGGDFNGHSAGNDTCVVDGTHVTTAKLPATFMVNDEIYYTQKFRMDNQVVLRCGADKRPIAWVRQEGAGRVFYEALGHNDVQWTTPPLVDSLVVPGILWSMGR